MPWILWHFLFGSKKMSPHRTLFSELLLMLDLCTGSSVHITWPFCLQIKPFVNNHSIISTINSAIITRLILAYKLTKRFPSDIPIAVETTEFRDKENVRSNLWARYIWQTIKCKHYINKPEIKSHSGMRDTNRKNCWLCRRSAAASFAHTDTTRTASKRRRNKQKQEKNRWQQYVIT